MTPIETEQLSRGIVNNNSTAEGRLAGAFIEVSLQTLIFIHKNYLISYSIGKP